jgi:hypothetical protein
VAVEGDAVVVHPGYAIDCAGNDVIVPQCERLPLTGMYGRLFVTVEYAEIPMAPQPSIGLGDTTEFSRILEGVQLALAQGNPAAAHRGMGAGTPGCGASHAVAIASVTRVGRRWRLTPIRGIRIGRGNRRQA